MSTPSRNETQFSMALESIQSKRRIDRVLEAATALTERHTAQPLAADRVKSLYELIRKNFTPQLYVSYGALTLGAPVDADCGETAFTCDLPGADGITGHFAAAYTPPGTLGLTALEWASAMRLLTGITRLTLGGRA